MEASEYVIDAIKAMIGKGEIWAAQVACNDFNLNYDKLLIEVLQCR